MNGRAIDEELLASAWSDCEANSRANVPGYGAC